MIAVQRFFTCNYFQMQLRNTIHSLVCFERNFFAVQVTKARKGMNLNTVKNRSTGRKVATNTSKNGDIRRAIKFVRNAEFMWNAVIKIILNKFPFGANTMQNKCTHTTCPSVIFLCSTISFPFFFVLLLQCNRCNRLN